MMRTPPRIVGLALLAMRLLVGYLSCASLVNVFTARRGNGLLATSSGSSLPLLYAGAGIGLALLGPGPYALDGLLDLLSPSRENVSRSSADRP
jgi:hypothetical protein